MAISKIISSSISDNTVVAADIGPNAVGTSELADDAVVNAKIASGVSATKLTTGTLGNTVQDNITRLGTVTTGTLSHGTTLQGYVDSSNTGVTFPAGHVVQVVPHTNGTGTNVTSTSGTPIADSRGAITLKTDNPLILYNAVLGYESDTSASTNFFFDLRYSTDNSTYTQIDTTERINGTHVDNSLGTGSVTIVAHHDTSGITGFDAGSTIYYRLHFSKSTAPSIYFNQPNLSDQPANTTNVTSVYIMEVQQ